MKVYAVVLLNLLLICQIALAQEAEMAQAEGAADAANQTEPGPEQDEKRETAESAAEELRGGRRGGGRAGFQNTVNIPQSLCVGVCSTNRR